MPLWALWLLLILWAAVDSLSVRSFPAATTTRCSSWDDRLQQLQTFRTQYGHCRVSNSHDPSLYQWTRTVRKQYNQKTLDANKTAQLEALDFCWNLQEFAWEKNYQQLRLYHLIHRDCLVSNTNRDYPGLGVWVRNQRREYRNYLRGRPHTLTEERLDKLNALNFQWSRNQTEIWEENYEKLVQYRNQHGHVNVPQTTSLGRWCMNQRTYFRRNFLNQATALTETRIAHLEAVGFQWNIRNHIWEENLQQLKEYYGTHGTVDIPVSATSNTYLRHWLNLQRFKYNTGRLSESRIEKLEGTIPEFKWRARQKTAPSNKDWANLFDAMRNLGISEKVRPKTHWFEGQQRNSMQVKDRWTEQDLLELWNSADDDEDDDDD